MSFQELFQWLILAFVMGIISKISYWFIFRYIIYPKLKNKILKSNHFKFTETPMLEYLEQQLKEKRELLLPVNGEIFDYIAGTTIIGLLVTSIIIPILFLCIKFLTPYF